MPHYFAILPVVSVYLVEAASHHNCNKEALPAESRRKQNMLEWPITKHMHTEEDTMKNKLTDFVNSARRKYDIMYKINEITKESVHTILPLSPYFYEINSIQLRQAQVSLYCHEQWNI
jgi:hypothetical protein